MTNSPLLSAAISVVVPAYLLGGRVVSAGLAVKRCKEHDEAK